MVYLFYTSFYQRFSAEKIALMLQQVPVAVQEEILRFKNWEDVQRGLLGKMLLSKALKIVGINTYSLSDIKYTNHKKPYFDQSLSFNISHSGNYIVCVLSKDNSLGVDIEIIEKIEIQDMQSHFSSIEWLGIMQASDQLRVFYKYWTQKEAFLKAIGLGLSYSPEKVSFTDNTILWQGKTWYSQEILLDQGYACHVVTDEPNAAIVIERIEL